MGVLVAGVAMVNLRDATNPRRWRNAAFWGLYAVTFLAGSYLPDVANGVLVIAMVLVASIGKLGQTRRESQTPAQRAASAARVGQPAVHSRARHSRGARCSARSRSSAARSRARR